MKPVLFHVHGIDEYDFSSLDPSELAGLEQAAAAREVDLVPTIYLRRAWLARFRHLLEGFAREREQFPSILGFSMEGPLLGPEGGIPREGSWLPSVEEWRDIADLGHVGLRYIVIAPDALGLNDELGPGFTFADLIAILYESGVRVALGHFRREDPPRSADNIERLLGYVAERCGPSRQNVITDHLFNDMPRNFTHSWRGKAAEHRQAELAEFLPKAWTTESVSSLLGPVPATLLNAAKTGRLLPCLNFDGEHVDLEICRKTVGYLGAENLIAITDHTETSTMAGELLERHQGSTLWYRDDGIVAAGSTGLKQQIANMRSIGMGDADIEAVFDRNPHSVMNAELLAIA